MFKEKGKLKPSELITVIVFMAALGFLSVMLFVLPKHAGELSELEFRTLASDPFKGKDAGTLVTELVRGDMSKNVDKFLEDHYPGRNFFIALNSYYLRYTGRNADQSVVMGKKGRLFDAPLSTETDQLDKNIEKINEFAETNGLETVLAIVPSSAVTDGEDLPAVHFTYPDRLLLDRIREKTGAYVPDIAGIFDGEDGLMMYRTDHHWTMDGAYAVYKDVMAHFGAEACDNAAFSRESYDFYGSFYRKAGLWLTAPDTLEIWNSPAFDAMTVTIGTGDTAVTYTGVYDRTQLDGVDKYAAYLWSNNDLTVVENPNGNGETVMIVKDSFGNSVAPLFAMTYSRVVMIDTRYYMNPSLPMPSELAAEYGIEKLVVAMGLDSAVSNITIAFLR